MDLINTVQTWGAYDNNGQNTPDKTEDDTPAMLSISAPLTSGDKANLIAEGDIYLGDMFGLYRFENWFYQITMSGEEVHQWLEFAATKIRVDGEGVPYVTNGDLTYYDVIMGDGFHYEIVVSKPEGERVVNMKYQGQPVRRSGPSCQTGTPRRRRRYFRALDGGFRIGSRRKDKKFRNYSLPLNHVSRTS